MRARRTLALLAAAGAMVVAAAGGALVAPSLAVAAPPTPYPAPPPAVTVNSTTVTIGHSVRATGTGFAPRERISIRIRTQINRGGYWHNRVIVQSASSVRTDRQGNFRTRIRLRVGGTATITFTGRKSHTSASVTIHVLGWHRPWPRQWRNPDFDNSADFQANNADLTTG